MPGHGKEKAASQFPDSNKANHKKRKDILNARKVLLDGKSLVALSQEAQLKFCQLNLKLMESYWESFEIARNAEDYESAARYFFKALSMGFTKATDLYNEKAHSKIRPEKLSAFIHPEKNFYIGIRYYLGLGLPQNHEEAVLWYIKAANQGDALALDNLKIIDTPLACYAVAILEKNEATAIQLALSHEELLPSFIEKDFENILRQKIGFEDTSAMLALIKKTTESFNKNANAIFINIMNATQRRRFFSDTMKTLRN